MRYTLKDGLPVQVKYFIDNNTMIVNPTDEQIDAASTGYPLTETQSPEYNSETEYLINSYIIQDNAIVKVWTTSPLTNDMKIQALQQQINEINNNFETWKNSPVAYTNGKGYYPRWVSEYYNAMLILGSSIFPQSVSATDGTSAEFTYEEFQQLYSFLIAAATARTTTDNAEIATLNAQIAELQVQA